MSVTSARAKVVKEWEIVEQLGDDKYSCKQIRNDEVMKINPDYTETWSGEEIIKTRRDYYR